MTESTKPDHFPDITKVISKDGKLSHLTEEEKRDWELTQKATEGRVTSQKIAMRPTEQDYRQLQIECKQIGESFIKILCDIYETSEFSILYHPQLNQPLQLIYKEEYRADNVRAQMKLAIDLHIAEFNKRFGLTEER